MRNALDKVRFVLGRTVILFIGAYVILFQVFDFKQAVELANIRTLNRLRPENTAELVSVDVLPYKELEKHEMYYRNVVRYIPNRADAYGLLGYCSYYLGAKEEAKKYYQKAVQINPGFFWYYFNPGVIHFLDGEYEQAEAAFQSALKIAPKDNFDTIAASARIYRPIINQRIKNGEDFAELVKNDYQQAIILLRESKFRQSGDTARPMVPVPALQVF